MKIAIIGAGFTGLATSTALVEDPFFKNSSITIFDVLPIGNGTSGIAAGLLHPFAGAHAKLNFWGREGMEASLSLIQKAEKALGESVQVPSKGILRLAITEGQKTDFQLCSEKFKGETSWLNENEVQSLLPNVSPFPGLWIRQGIGLFPSLYLKGLMLHCKMRGVVLEQRRIEEMEALKGFDLVILASGAETMNLKGLPSLSIKKVKGQLLELEWPQNIPPLSLIINSQVYLLMGPSNKTCFIGSTFEKTWSSDQPDSDFAKKELLPKIGEFFPLLREAKVINCHAGFRAVTQQHRPLMKQILPKTWILTGMGSKGLLYHALYANFLIEEIKKSIQ